MEAAENDFTGKDERKKKKKWRGKDRCESETRFDMRELNLEPYNR